ncbi:MAG: PAS domain-containing protein, partial [Acetobacteraceae bacterium]|nr:PAS domain-containing protein [Acetobacteraceae bacterium]
MTSDMPRSRAGSDDGEAGFAAIAAAVVRQAPIFVGLCDAQFRLCFLNASARDMIGLSGSADVTAYRIADVVSPQHRLVVEDSGLPTVLREGHWESELCLRHLADPSRQTEVRWSAFALRDAFAGLIATVAFPPTTPVRKRAASRIGTAGAALATRSRFLEATLSSIPDFVYAFDPQ